MRKAVPLLLIATKGRSAFVLLIVLYNSQSPFRSFVDVSIFPFRAQAATILPIESTAACKDVAPDKESVEAIPQLPRIVLEQAFTNPDSIQRAVVFPLGSISKMGVVGLELDKVELEPQLPFTALLLALK